MIFILIYFTNFAIMNTFSAAKVLKIFYIYNIFAEKSNKHSKIIYYLCGRFGIIIVMIKIENNY